MITLAMLNVSCNRLTGTLPPSLSKLTNLVFLDARRNRFSGPVTALPVSMQILRLSDNGFTAVDLHSTPRAVQILAANNNIHQPLDVGAMPSLVVLDVSFNSIYGSLNASSLNRLSRLEVLSCQGNALSGGVPSLDRPLKLKQLNLASNALGSSIPTSLGTLSALEVLDLSGNLLTGSMPPEIFRPRSPLRFLSLSSNLLSGSVPSTLALLLSLVSLNIDHNKLTSLPDLSSLLNVTTIDVSFNFIKGQLAASLFAPHPRLESVVASQNCFGGPLPAEAICSARRLSVLVLDGLGLGAPGCGGAISGGIPACILSLPNLTTLHLSGNGIDGALLLLDAAPAASLQDLSLGYNLLQGPIPPRLLAAASQFHTLDLSYNRLVGDLGAMATPRFYSRVLLLVNRLSGPIPEALLRTLPPPLAAPAAQTGSRLFSILEGSMFDCDALADSSTTLPQDDPYAKRFQCGSDSFDKYLISLAAVICFIPLLARCYGAWAPPRFAFPRFDFFPAPLPALPRDVAAVFHVLLKIRLLAAFVGAGYIVLLLPIYAAASAAFSTQEFAYTYSVSAAYKSGVAPAASFLVLWALVVLASVFFISVFAGVDQREGQDEASPVETETEGGGEGEGEGKKGGDERCSAALWARLATVFVIDSVCVAAGNYAFLLVVATADVSGQVFAKLSFALFKFLTNNYGMPALLRLLLSASSRESGRKEHIHFRAFLLILNAVIIPCVVTAMQSNSCFLPLISYPAPVIVSYPKTICALEYRAVEYRASLSNQLTFIGLTSSLSCKTLGLVAAFRPPFNYNYQCSSFLVATYAPVFLIVALISVAEFAIHNLLAALLGRLVAAQPALGPWRFIVPVVPKLLLSHSLRHAIRRAQAATDETETKGDDSQASRPDKDRFGLLEDKGLYYRSLSDVLAIVSFGVVVPLLAAGLAIGVYVRALRKHNMLARYLEHCSGRMLSLGRAADLEGAALQAAKESLLRLAQANAAGNKELAAAVQAVAQPEHASFEALSAALLAAYDPAVCPSCPEAEGLRQRVLLLEALDLQREWECFLDECGAMAGAKRATSTPLDEVREVLLVFTCLFLSLFLVDIGGDAVGAAAAAWAPVLVILAPPLLYLLACHALPTAVSRGAVRWAQVRLLPPPPPSGPRSPAPPSLLRQSDSRLSFSFSERDGLSPTTSRLSSSAAPLDVIPAEAALSHAAFLGRLRSQTNPLHAHPMRASEASHDSL